LQLSLSLSAQRVMVAVNAFNISGAFFLCISTILPWVILMSLHTRAVRDAEGVSNDAARYKASLYLAILVLARPRSLIRRRLLGFFSLSLSRFRCTYYLHSGDLSAGGAACTFAGHQINPTSGETYWKWGTSRAHVSLHSQTASP
jgi:hypothetical protein